MNRLGSVLLVLPLAGCGVFSIPWDCDAEVDGESSFCLQYRFDTGCAPGGDAEEGQPAIEAAVETWSSHLVSPSPIVLELRWVSDRSTPTTSVLRAPIDGVGYTYPLAETLLDDELNRERPDVLIRLPCEGIDWYLGVDHAPGAEQRDLYTTVLHETTHGLGFSSTMDVDTTGEGIWGEEEFMPDVFEILAEDVAGEFLVDETVYPNPSMRLGTTLTTAYAVAYAGTAAVEANGGEPVTLYTDSNWTLGTTFVHLDPSFHWTADDLMTPFRGDGESVAAPGPVTCAMLQDMGWELGSDCLAQLP